MRPAWTAALVGCIPPGDLLAPLTRVAIALGRWMRGLWDHVAVWGFARIGRLRARARPARATWPEAADLALQSWSLAGALFLEPLAKLCGRRLRQMGMLRIAGL